MICQWASIPLTSEAAYGVRVIYPKGIAANNKIPELLDNAKNGIPDRARQLFWRLYEYLLELNTQIKRSTGK
jgi:hypothetical protein